MWIDVFRTGSFTATDGAARYFGKADLDRIIQQYDPRVHEAPVTVGEVKAGSPAYGWVKALKREGSVLYAEIKAASTEFLEMVKRKVFSKRTVTFYPSGDLRSIGFLGADPPDIGLSKLPGLCAFSESAERDAIAAKIAIASPKGGNNMDAVYAYEFEEYRFTERDLRNGNAKDGFERLMREEMQQNPSQTRAEAFLVVVAQNDPTLNGGHNS